MEHNSFKSLTAKFAGTFAALVAFLIGFAGHAQTTVTYTLGNNGYYTIKTTGTSGTFLPSGTAELGMYSNGGGTKNVVAYRDFKTAGDNSGSVRALQVGDIFSLQVWASSAFGQIGFSLNTSNVTTDYSTRNTNSRLYVQEDGTNGSWYVNSSAGNQTLDYNVSSTYRNYLFKVYITSETTCDVELIVDGSVTKRLFNRTMNGVAGANITGFALYLSDDWNGSANSNIYWKQVTEVRANTSVNLGYYLDSGTFTPGRVTNGLAANSTSISSVNAVNIGGDSGTTVILNQPNTYTGNTTINSFARADMQHVQAFGSSPSITVSNNGALTLSTGGTGFVNYPLTINGNGQNGANGALRNVVGANSWPGAITLGSPSRIQADNSLLTITGPINLGVHTLTTGGSAPLNLQGVISGSGGLTVAQNQTALLAANTYGGNTTINSGATLRLGANNVVPDASNIILNGGTLNSGTLGYNDTFNLLSLQASSTIALASGSHALTFADSSEEPWTGTLTITGWLGTAGLSNTSGGRIFVGVGGLTGAQLAQISFQGRPGTPVILPSGELVPPGPTFAVTAGATDHGTVCVNASASPITYTITNTGAAASGVSVVSDNPEFVVSNLSSTSIPLNGTATYQVTFTPSASGNRSATISINTTTAGSNTPVVSNLSGIGLVPAVYYADNDNDTFGDSSVFQSGCIAAPSGYVTNNTDCDDNNAAIYQSAMLYIDADNDGYDAGQQTVCYGATIPAGYSTTTNGTDCDDTRNTVNPGATEIGYNLIDDDCDGLTDEGFPPKITIVNGTQCGLTLAAIDTPIVANIVAGAQGYRWRITTLTGPNASQVQTLDTALRTMKLTQLVNYAFNTQYKVEVAVYFAGFLQPYNASFCTVTTPEGMTSLTNCTQTLTAMSNAVYANIVPYATGYRFRITDPINPINTQVLERSVRDFRMTQITNFVVQFGKTYNVAVSVKNTDGSWMSYSGDCQVTTPVFPTTSVQDSQCDDYAVPSNSTPIYAISYPGAIAYVFQLSGGGLPAPIEVTRSTRTFTLNDFAGQILPGATYNVKVRLVFNLADPAGPYGKTCSITTPGASRMTGTKIAFDATAYPNPFTDNFEIALQSTSTLDVNVKVYDMTGRLLEDRKVKSGAAIEAGSALPSGVYNVVVTQGAEVKSLRVVKR